MIAILQPFVPHYREEFFRGLNKAVPGDMYCYESAGTMKQLNFKETSVPVKQIKGFSAGPFLFYNPFILLSSRYKVLVLMLHFGHLTTWLLLLTRFIHRKKIIVWGHGISVKRYESEQHRPSILLRAMISLADGVWFYTSAELTMWRKYFPKKEMISLNNTIAEVSEILQAPPLPKIALKEKYHIPQPTVLIFCARFNSPDRRPDLLEEVIKKLDPTQFGFVIIGDGPVKPDFTPYKNVYDFGGLYDRQIKNELFHLSDLYFQPGWVGLSIVEAMAYRKPIVTFHRSAEVLQCVEYAYIQHGVNGLVFNNTNQLVEGITKLSTEETMKLGEQAREYVINELSMQGMIANAVNSLKHFHGN